MSEYLLKHRCLLAEAICKRFNSCILLHLMFKNSTDLCFTSLWLELLCSDLVVVCRHRMKRSFLPLWLGLVNTVRENTKLLSFELFLSILFLLPLSIDVIWDVINLMLSLLNCRNKLHRIVCCVSESLLKVSNLPRKFALRSYTKITLQLQKLKLTFIFSIFSFYLWLIFQLDTFLFEYSAFHVLDHFFLLFT